MENISDISNEVITRLNSYLDEKFGIRNYVYTIQEATKKGDNYMGVVYRIVITSQKEAGVNFKVILKVPPQNPIRREQFFSRPVFVRESVAYGEFLPLAQEFQKSKAIPDSQIFYEYPLCYFSLTNEFHEAICMEDLQESGFYMHDRFKPLSRDQVVLIMNIYGKLHGTSLAMKDQNPEKLTHLKKMVDIFAERRNDSQLNEYFESLKISALQSLDRNVEEDYWCKLNEYFRRGTFYDLMMELLDSETSEPFAVICHGDCWINNIMFKEENGNVCDARLIDWQIMRYASPIMDLMYFMMSCTTKTFRDHYFKEMLDIYHASAADHIQRLGSNPQRLYRRSDVDKELKAKGAVGLIFSMIVLPILTTKSEDVPDLEKLSEKVSKGQSTDAMEAGFTGAKSTLYNERMSGIIRDCVDWGLI